MNLIKSTGTFSFFTIISRLLGYVRDILIAVFLGAGPIADAFFVAFRIPNTFRRLFSEGTFNAAFIPSYSSLLNNKRDAQKFANNIFNLLIVGLFFLVLAIEIMMPLFVYLIAPGFEGDQQKMELAITLTRITFPFLMFISLASFFSAILNSHNKFAIASAAPIILNILLIGVLLFGKILNDQLVIYLSYAVTLSGILQFIFLYLFVKKYFSPKFKLNIKIDNKVKIFFRKLLPSIFSSGVTQINILVGTIIASFEAGAVSYLYYADRIYQINLAIAGIAIGTVVLPELSKKIKIGNISEVMNIQNKSIELCLILSIPACFGLIIASHEITSSLFGYGSFLEKDVILTSQALMYFGLGVPAFALIKILSNFFFARDNTKIPFYISVFSIFLNISISVLFFKEFGFIIIPIATSFATWCAVIIYLILLLKFKYIKISSIYYMNFIKTLVSAVIMSLVLYFLINFFEDKLTYTNYYKSIYLIMTIVLSATIYLLVSRLLGVFKIKNFKIN